MKTETLHQDWPHVDERLVDLLQTYTNQMPKPDLSAASAEDTLKYYAALQGAQGVVDMLRVVRRRQQLKEKQHGD